MQSVVSRFIEVAQENPQAIAVTRFVDDVWESVTYEQVLLESERFAQLLSRAGVLPGEAVVIPSLRSHDLVSKLLGILWVGGHYVFIDPKLPEKRQSQIVETTGAKLGFDLNKLQVNGVSPLLDTHLSDSDQSPPLISQAHDVAYIKFTSGSTGEPKGVIIPHKAIVRLVVDSNFISFEGPNIFMLHSALSFDAATLELWGPLLNGGRCVICPPEITLAPDNIGSIVQKTEVTNLWLTSSFFNLLISENPDALQSIKQLLIGGEVLSVRHVRSALAFLPNTRIFNGYGPTENTTFTTVYPIPRELPGDIISIPIGFPVTGTECEVFDELLRPVAQGEEGELLAFGKGVAIGYLGREDLTGERFVEVKRINGQVERAYRTGDLVRQAEDGCFEYIGRNDAQVKIEGHRIELGEIEVCLHSFDEVKDARVVLCVGPEGQKRLAAYIIWHRSSRLTPQTVRERLEQYLPAYMLPHFCLGIDTMPLNLNGKLDMKALPDPYVVQQDAPKNVSETLVKECWYRILGRHVAKGLNFMDAGGTSIESIRLRAELARDSQQSLSETFVFEYPTIASQEGYFYESNNAVSINRENPHSKESNADIAVIGMACRVPGANDVETFWNNIVKGEESITFFTDAELDTSIPAAEKQSKHYVPAKGVLQGADKFDAAFFGISPLEADIMDPQHRVMLELVWHALENAGYEPPSEGLDIGLFAGANWGRYYQQKVLNNKEITSRFGKFNAALANESDFLCTRISYKLNLQGPSVNVYSACSTGLVAISQACAAIELGQCDMAIAGGVSISTPLNAGYLYQEGGMLSKDGHCRPFDCEASGTTFNDGAGTVVLKRLDMAKRDGDTIHAVIKGYAVNNDGAVKASYTAPSVGGQVAVYKAAIEKSGVDPTTIGLIETHGTATPLGDPIEVASLNQVYGADGAVTNRCALGSVKSNIGHTIHAAGVIGFIKSVCSVRDGIIPATLFFKDANAKLSLDKSPFFVNGQLSQWQAPGIRRAAVSSLGVGGTNAHVIVEEYNRHEAQCSEPDSEIHSVLISAKSKISLQALIRDYMAYLLEKGSKYSLKDIAYSSQLKPGFDYRIGVSALTHQSMVSQLEKQLKSKVRKVESAKPKQVVFLFTGQGSQKREMGGWLYQNDSNFKRLVDRGSEILQDEFNLDLRALMLGHDQAESMESKLTIDSTVATQPALFLFELGVAQYLERRGVKADICIGHSIGEYAAGVLSGVFKFEDAIRIVACRGKLMQALAPGSMLAVKTERENFQDLLTSRIDLAASNAPKLNVVSGVDSAISEIDSALKERGVATTLLATSHAFHSSMMEPMLDEFSEYISRFKLSSPSRKIYSSLTGTKVDETQLQSSEYWVRQIRESVLFSDALQAMSNDFADHELALIEVGPGTTLTSLVGMHQLSPVRVNVAAVPGSAIGENTPEELARCLNKLWVNGFPLDWHVSDNSAHRVSLPLYAFEKNRHWISDAWQQVVDNQATETASIPNQTKFTERVTQVIKMSSQEHLEAVNKKLIAVLEDITGYDLEKMEPEAQFSEAGLDSLLLTQVAIALEQEFGGNITFRHLVEEYTSLKELSEFYVELLPVETKTSQTAPTQMASVENTASFMPNVQMAVSSVGQGQTGNAVLDVVNSQLSIMQMQLQALGSNVQLGSTQVVAGENLAGASESVGAGTKTGPEEKESKVRSKHAPGAKITKKSIGIKLALAQKEWVDEKLNNYQKKYAGSKAYAQKHREYFADPRTVSGFNPEWKEIIFQIVTKASKGSKLWDIDGNELIDITNGFGPILFGHSPDFISEAVKQQIDKGIETGPSSPLAGEVAKLFCELTGNERCSFASTGSEAVMGAIRLARTVTGRKTVVMFEGAYHGIFDEVITRPGRDYQALPAAPGIMREMTSNMLVLPWGDPESIEVIKELENSLAAVLVEPVQSRKPGFHDASYLHQLRSVTKDVDAALILDEVVTGFRVAPGGIRERFDIDADLATYGKVVGGGYPIGIIGGKAKFMDALDGGHWQYGDDSIPEVGVTFFAGTFVRHPVSLAAAKAVMMRIKEHGAEIYDGLERKTSGLASAAKQFVKEMNCDVSFEEFASLFYISVPTEAHWGHLLYVLMVQDGINVQQYRPCFLTTAHSDDDVAKVLFSFKKSLAELIKHGLIEGDMLAAKKFLQGKPQIPEGAKLGRNAQGEPAYFIEDPENKGQYLEVGRP
jgi:amino acid adenylation domain-containing protein